MLVLLEDLCHIYDFRRYELRAALPALILSYRPLERPGVRKTLLRVHDPVTKDLMVYGPWCMPFSLPNVQRSAYG